MNQRIAALVICLVVGSAVAAQQQGKETRSGFVEKVFAAWNSHDPDQVVKFFTPDAIYEDVAFGEVSRGSAELRKFAADFMAAVPDLHLEVTRSSIHNGQGVSEWVLTGTDQGLYKTGKKFSVRGASVFEMRSGKCSSNKDFYDLATIMRQVGVLAEKPVSPQ